MQPRFGKRTWVKLWVNEWLDGTTRYQMSGAQRAFWVDLLALAGRSRYAGIICAGKDGDLFVGYPLKTFSALDAGAEIDVEVTFDLFSQSGKIIVEITSESPVRLYKITICNWEKYQSEYRRQKRYRGKKLQGGLHGSDNKSDKQGDIPEAEAETDSEVEEKQKQAAAAFKSLGFDLPFGDPRFQQIWASEYQELPEDGSFTDAMERVAQKCKSLKVPVPPVFFTTKRRVEQVETQNKFRRAPL